MASLAASLWHENQDLVAATLRHSFIQGIASGALSPAAFAYYTGQDAIYLKAFHRAYDVASSKCPDDEGRSVFAELRDAAAAELSLHHHYAERWGVDLDQPEGPVTTAYTTFLADVAESEPVGHIAAAMTPCMRLYTYLGRQLIGRTHADNPFREWVTTYASDQFDGLTQRLEALLDRYARDQARMSALYRRAMTLELEFFSEAVQRQH